MNLTKDILNIIKKYESYKVYIVLRRYKENSCDIHTDLFGTYSSHNKAYTSVCKEIDRLYKKYNKYSFESKDNYKIDFYDNFSGERSYIGSITYTTIYTKHETIGIFENTRYLQYVYDIQEHYLDVRSPEE